MRVAAGASWANTGSTAPSGKSSNSSSTGDATYTTHVAAADREFAAWMRQNLHHAAEHFGVTITGPDMLGWRLLSISAPVDEDRWLRVTTEAIEWAHGRWWTGNLDANAITGIRKPVVLTGPNRISQECGGNAQNS